MASTVNRNPHNAQVTCVLGKAGTGKTQMLLEEAARLLASGTSPENMVIFAASPAAALESKKRLVALSDTIGFPREAGEAMQVETMRHFALEILDSADAREFTGREPRMLLPFETNILMEDAKTTGVRPKRLKEMLRFLFRGWTELADDDPDWIITQEEQLVVDTLKESLALTHGMLEAEIANLAVHYLRAQLSALDECERMHVFVDDYQAHNVASQVLAGMLAAETLFVTGDPCLQAEVFESYPNAEGLTQLCANPSACTRTLDASFRSTAAQCAANALLSDPCFAECATATHTPGNTNESGNINVHAYHSPEEELTGVASLVSHLVENGTKPADIFVAAPNRTWLNNLAIALGNADIEVDSVPLPQTLAGDVRNARHCTSELAFTALALAARPDDALALRSWIAFGDHLAGSSVFAALRKKHQETGNSLPMLLEQELVALSNRDEEAIYNLASALEAYARGKQLAISTASLQGKELLDALTSLATNGERNTAPANLLQLCTPIAEGATAQELYEQAREKLTFPSFGNGEGSANAVKLGLFEHAIGLNPQIVVLTGFVNGFFPKRQFFEDATYSLVQRDRMHAADTKALYALASKPMQELHVTYFEETSLEAASSLNLKVERIKMRKGQRMCTIAPSVFLEVLTGASE